MSNQKAKFSYPMIALAVATLALSSYGLFDLAHTYGGVPTFFSILVVAGFDLFAIAAGNHAMRVARDGDSAGPWNLAVVGIAILSAVLQYAHTVLAGNPWPIGVMMAMFPLATVMLFEGTLRRAHRLNGRLTGRVAQPRASFELMQWIVFPRATWLAFRLGVQDRSLGGEAAFIIGIERTTTTEPVYVPPARRQFAVDYQGQGIRELAGPSGGESGNVPPETPAKRSLTDLVRESIEVRGPDVAAVVEDVKAANPDAKEDSIRRTFRKQTEIRSA